MDDAPGTLLASPPSARVRFGGTLALRASVPVSWSVEEGQAAGSVDDDGTYHAPLQRGTFHVVATSLSHPPETARVELQVGPVQLDPFVGHIGGFGFADGVGTDARFGRVGDIVGDGLRTLFVIDGENQAIRKIDTDSGAVSTLMRTGRSDDWLSYLAYGEGSLFALFQATEETTEDQLLIIDPTSGAVRATEALPHPELYNHVFGAKMRARGIAVIGSYIYEMDERQIFRRPREGGAWWRAAGDPTPGTTDGPGMMARFAELQEILPDGRGALRLLDCVSAKPSRPSDPPDACAMRSYDPDTMVVSTLGSLTTTTGTPMRGLHRMSIDQGNQYFVSGQMVWDSLVTSIATWRDDSLYQVNTSWDAIWAQQNNIFVADHENNLIRTVGPLEKGKRSYFTTVTTLAGMRPYSGYVDNVGQDARFYQTRLLGADAQGGLILLSQSAIRHADLDGKTTTLGGWDMQGLAIDQGVWIYTSNTDNCVRSWDPTGHTGEWLAGNDMGHPGNRDGVLFDAAFNQPAGVATDGQGTFYIADRGNGSLRRLVRSTKTVTTLATGLNAPVAVVVGDGEIFVGEEKSVRRIRIDSGQVSTLSGAEDGWKQISAVAYDPVGLLYVSDQADHRVRGINVKNGQVFDVIGVSGQAGVRFAQLPAGINAPSGLALLPSGDLAVSSYAENAIVIAR